MAGELIHADPGPNLTHTEYVDGAHLIDGGATGALLYYDGTSVNSIAIGTVGQLLVVVGGVPTWQTFSSIYFPMLAPDGLVGAPSYSWASDTDTGFYRPSANAMTAALNGQAYFSFTTNGLRQADAASVGWTSGDSNAATDLFLYRDAANALAQRNGTTAQVFNIYNTWTDASNYESGGMVWSANVFHVRTTQAGTGVARTMKIGTDGAAPLDMMTTGTLRWSISATGHFLAGADNTYDIGASGASSPRNVYVGTSFFAGISFKAPDGSAAAPSYTFTGDTNTGILRRTTDAISFSLGGGSRIDMALAGAIPQLTFGSNLFLSWEDNTAAGTGTPDTRLYRDAANTLAQRNGTTAQTHRIYETFTDTSNYSRLEIVTRAGSYLIGTTAAGTGTARDLEFMTSGAGRWQISTSGHFITVADNTYDIGAGGATRPRSFYWGTALIGPGTNPATAGAIRLVNNSYIIWRNQGNTADLALGLNVNNKFELSVNSGFQVGANTTRATTQPTNSIDLFNGTAPVGTLANGATFYAQAGEMWVMDAGGTGTQLSPHDPEGYWWFNSRKENKALQIDVEKILRFVNDKYGLDMVRELELAGT